MMAPIRLCATLAKPGRGNGRGQALRPVEGCTRRHLSDADTRYRVTKPGRDVSPGELRVRQKKFSNAKAPCNLHGAW